MDTLTNEKSKDLENAYKLIKKIKIELNNENEYYDSKDKMNAMINEVSGILEENTKEEPEQEELLEEPKQEERGTLIISAEQQKVILPYTKDHIEVYINDGKYETEEEVIENEYTVPLSKYKNEALARVVEGYKLARIKEGKTVMESVKYAINLLFERRLHPAIVTACKTIDELDIYLACLDENVPELFDFFNVVFEYAPTKIDIQEDMFKMVFKDED